MRETKAEVREAILAILRERSKLPPLPPWDDEDGVGNTARLRKPRRPDAGGSAPVLCEV